VVDLIVGGEGQIGSALKKHWNKKGKNFHSSTRNKNNEDKDTPLIDLSNPKTFENLQKYNYAIICAAITDILECEKNPKITRKINVLGTLKLITKLVREGTKIIYLSSNHVFDGETPLKKYDSIRNPVNEYGRQKAETESIIEKKSNIFILRLTKVVHKDLAIIKQWVSQLKLGKEIFAFYDMSISPIDINVVLDKIDNLMKSNKRKISQLSGERDISYYQFAKELAKRHGYSGNLVIKKSWKDTLQFVPPKFTSLTNV